jgi:hypothetical protein
MSLNWEGSVAAIEPLHVVVLLRPAAQTYIALSIMLREEMN